MSVPSPDRVRHRMFSSGPCPMTASRKWADRPERLVLDRLALSAMIMLLASAGHLKNASIKTGHCTEAVLYCKKRHLCGPKTIDPEILPPRQDALECRQGRWRDARSVSCRGRPRKFTPWHRPVFDRTPVRLDAMDKNRVFQRTRKYRADADSNRGTVAGQMLPNACFALPEQAFRHTRMGL